MDSKRASTDASVGEERPFIIYALQGGGALGAYQAGAFRAMVEHDMEPDWATGISIGSVNSSLIAGNPKEARLARVMEFWDRVASLPRPWELVSGGTNRLTSAWELGHMCVFGQRNFFRPWPVPVSLALPGTRPATSYYTTEPLRQNLLELVDFDYLATAEVRLSLGASKIFGGELAFFDNTKTRLRVEHILASGAYPPSFPAVEIDGNSYWDGGVVANTSIRYLEPEIAKAVPPGRKVLVVSVNLWQTYDPEPRTMDEVTWRIKQIQFSTGARNDLMELAEKLRGTAAAKDAAEQAKRIHVCLVGYRATAEDMPYGDGDFSRSAIQRRIDRGYADMRHVFLENPRLGARIPETDVITPAAAADRGGSVHFF